MESSDRSQNGFLNSLSASDLGAICPYLKTVQLSAESWLNHLGQAVTQVYFPHSAVVSLVVELSEGQHIEVAMIGRDSLLGAFGAIGEPVALINAVVLLPGSASAIEVARLRAVAEQSATLRHVLVRHEQALFVQAQQSAGCNACHPVEARLARWLLRVRDLYGSDSFNLTQELTAQMIGARRNSVSLVAHTLQQTKIIRYSRGHIEILDLAALKRTACECYGAVNAQYQRLRFSA
jgi:CRP-like cAMP-binding protein